MTTIDSSLIGEWPFIPSQAFLYFPTGEEIRLGQKQKQWRKIFENGEQYQEFELKQLQRLETKLQQKSIILDSFFSRANKLRFLQANKFKVSNTVDAMVQYTKWRITSFPVKMTIKIEDMLNSGAFYFCGRDNKYRPIIVANIGKFNSDDADLIPETLVVMMQFMINHLLIQGQVQNYILIMNLDEFSLSLRGIVMKILFFTSNSYRGRLFVSYLLSAPTVLYWGWEGIVSNFISENTLRKIKITKKAVNDEMWTHISKEIIEKQYGGNMLDMRDSFWPPRQQLLLFVDTVDQQSNDLVSPARYRELYLAGRLQQRKVNKHLAGLNEPAPVPVKQVPISATSQKDVIKHQEKSEQRPGSRMFDAGPMIEQHINEKLLTKSHEQLLPKQSEIRTTKSKTMIKTETVFAKDTREIVTFFGTDAYRKICKFAPLTKEL